MTEAFTGSREIEEAACRFLQTQQDASGEWKDFLLPAGHSNLWVTAFVGLALAELPCPQAHDSVLAAWDFLEQQSLPSGGWSYNREWCGDGDSTLWGLRLAAALGLRDSACARAADHFLDQHVTPDGGLSTYASAEMIRQDLGMPPFLSFAGWIQSHVCVSAAGAHLESRRARLRPYLLARQDGDGRWPAYWWLDDEYSTAEAATALAAGGSREDQESVERAVEWALCRCGQLLAADGEMSVFALAHVLRVLVLTSRPAVVSEMVGRGIAALIRRQRSDGSWPPSARLRVPRPDVLNPAPSAPWMMWSATTNPPESTEEALQRYFTIYTPDHFGVYTTATVLRTLGEFAAQPAFASVAG